MFVTYICVADVCHHMRCLELTASPSFNLLIPSQTRVGRPEASLGEVGAGGWCATHYSVSQESCSAPICSAPCPRTGQPTNTSRDHAERDRQTRAYLQRSCPVDAVCQAYIVAFNQLKPPILGGALLRKWHAVPSSHVRRPQKQQEESAPAGSGSVQIASASMAPPRLRQGSPRALWHACPGWPLEGQLAKDPPVLLRYAGLSTP
jgi:hypothetical protein